MQYCCNKWQLILRDNCSHMKSQCIILYVERNICLPVTSASTWGCFKTNSYIKIGVYVYMSWWVFLLNMHKKCYRNILLQMLKFIFILLKNATYYSKSTWIHDDKFGKCFDILRFRKSFFNGVTNVKKIFSHIKSNTLFSKLTSTNDWKTQGCK